MNTVDSFSSRSDRKEIGTAHNAILNKVTKDFDSLPEWTIGVARPLLESYGLPDPLARGSNAALR